jgi:hypothetical protein
MDDEPVDNEAEGDPMDARGKGVEALQDELFGQGKPAAGAQPAPPRPAPVKPEARGGGDGTAVPAEREGPGGGDAGPREIDEPAYGFVRGPAERPGFIELQSKDGDAELGSYGCLHRVQWRPRGLPGHRGQAIVLRFSDGLTAAVIGRNLRPLLDGIRRQRAYRVTEMGEADARFLPPQDTVVYRLLLSGVEEAEGEGEQEEEPA